MHIKERLLKETARDYALRNIRYNIISLKLEPGDMVSEKELAAQLGISRTPIREALLELNKSQIIEILPQIGSKVSLIDYNLVEESRFIRMVLEKAIAETACAIRHQLDYSQIEENIRLQEFYVQNDSEKLLELDNQFHAELFRLCNRAQTFRLLDSMTIHFDRVRSMSLYTIRDTKIVQDHKEIIAAIQEGDEKKAVGVVEKHLSRYQIDRQALRFKHPNYFK